MIITICKPSFEKSKPKEVIYRNYKNFDLNTFKNVLRPKLKFIKSYESSDQVFLEISNEIAPLKKKYYRENRVPYVTKSLRKANVRSPELESKYLKNRTIENKAKYKKQKNFCSKLYKKEEEKFSSNLQLNQVTDNHRFRKTIKHLLSNRCIQSSAITLVNNEK